MLAWLSLLRSRRFFTFCCPAKCLLGHRRCAPMLKIAPVDFLHFAVLQNACSGHRRCAPMLKIAPVDFFNQNTCCRKNRKNEAVVTVRHHIPRRQAKAGT